MLVCIEPSGGGYHTMSLQLTPGGEWIDHREILAQYAPAPVQPRPRGIRILGHLIRKLTNRKKEAQC